MSKRIQYLWLILFVVLFILPYPLFNLFYQFVDTNNYDNRTLTSMPSLRLTQIQDYPSMFEQYIDDNLPFRNELISLNSIISVMIFKRSPSDKVILGKDGWLFYNSAAAEDGDSIADFQGTVYYTKEGLEAIRQNLIYQRDRLAERGIEFVVFLCPNKETVYSEKMPDNYGSATEYSRTQQIVDYIKDDIHIVYPLAELKDAKSDYPECDFYYHLDTHWNVLGAYVGANAVIDELGYELPSLGALNLSQSTSSGDLANMLNLGELMDDDIVYTLDNFAQDTKIIEWDYSDRGRCLTSSGVDKKVLMFGDSFSSASGPIIASCFKELVYCSRDRIEYNFQKLLDTEQPDIVILEVVERSDNMIMGFRIFE